MGDLYDLKNGPGPLKTSQGDRESSTPRSGVDSRGGGAKVQDLRRDRLVQPDAKGKVSDLPSPRNVGPNGKSDAF